MDPYRVADVWAPWIYDEVYDYDEEDEWLSDVMAEQAVAVAKRKEARDRARAYLAVNGAAVWLRVERSLSEARALAASHPGASIVAATTGSELMIRFMLLRPLVAGLVVSRKVAMVLVRHGQTRQTEPDRRLLPEVCRAWGIELEGLRVDEEQSLWDTLPRLVEVRNRYVHRAEPVLPENATGAIVCAGALRDQLVRPLAERVGLAWPPDAWDLRGRTHDPVEANFDFMGS